MNIKDQAINNIVEAMNNDELIIFVGAGVSANSGLPSWTQLIKELEEELPLENEENDNLRIAQYYYNTWGKHRYFQKINEIFNRYSNARPNSIHQEILKIQPSHLITTNYDTLLEDIMNKSIRKYEVIKKNEDIPYIKTKHYLIKMHGDLKEQNIVLKEDDYLDYNDNYFMIATLIKTLVMNHTLLFIGYSLNDSTFNSIFRLIQNFYGEDAKKSYFYDPKAKSKTTIEYYKKNGIHVISENIEIDEGGKLGEYTTNFLKSISKKRHIEVSNGKDIYRNLNFLNKLMFIEIEDIITYSGLVGKIHKTYVNTVANYYVKNLDLNSSVSELIEFLERKTWIDTFLNIKLNQQYFDCGFNSIQKEAYDKYRNEDYSQAKFMFREIANECYEKKDYFNFLLATFNYQNIYSSFNDNNALLYLNEDINETIDKIINYTDQDNKRIALYFRDVIFNYRFLYRKMETINYLYDELRKENYNFFRGGGSINCNLQKLKYEVKSLQQYIQSNCICVEHKKMYKEIISRYFECILIAHENSYYPKSSHPLFSNTSSIKDVLEQDDIEIIIDCFDFKLINSILRNFSFSKIKISKDAFDFIVNKVLELPKKNSSNYSLYKKLINFLYLVEITEHESIINIYDNFVINKDTIEEYIKILIILIRRNDKLENKILDIIFEHIGIILKNDLTDDYNRVFRLYNIILKKFENTPTLKIKTLSDKLITIDSDNSNLDEIVSIQNIVAELYEFFDKDDKQKIRRILKKYELKYKSFDGINHNFIYEMIVKDIYKFNIIKEKILIHLTDIINEDKKIEDIVYPNPVEDAIVKLFNLYMNGYYTIDKIKSTNIDFSKMQDKNPTVDWIWFNKRDEKTISGLLKNRDFKQTKKLFCKNACDRKAFDEWLVSNYDDSKYK